MKMLSIILVTFFTLSLLACDAQDNVNRPKTEMRTMIIGGMPVHDKDYQTVVNQNVESSAVSKK